MRRAGWGVWIAYDLLAPGRLPPNLLDELSVTDAGVRVT